MITNEKISEELSLMKKSILKAHDAAAAGYVNDLDSKFNSSKVESQVGVMDQVMLALEKLDYKKFCLKMMADATNNITAAVAERAALNAKLEGGKADYATVVESRGEISGRIVQWNAIYEYLMELSSRIAIQEYKER